MKESVMIREPTEIEFRIDFQAMKFSWKQRPVQAYSGGKWSIIREYKVEYVIMQYNLKSHFKEFSIDIHYYFVDKSTIWNGYLCQK